MDEILNFVYKKYKDKIIVLPSMLIDRFKSDDRNLKIVTYILKIYESIRNISIAEFSNSLEMSVIGVEIRKTTNNIELLRTMDQNNDVNDHLKKNINNLMILNEKIKNLRREKGVHYE